MQPTIAYRPAYYRYICLPTCGPSGFSSISFTRHVHIAEGSSLPLIVSGCSEFLRSEPFCRLLAHLTGLDLAEGVIRPSLEELDRPDSETSAASEKTSAAGSTKKKIAAAACSSFKDGESNSDCLEATPISPPSLESTDTPSSSHLEDENTSSALIGCGHPVANCRGDLYYWQPGDYTLASDFDVEAGEYALEAALYLCCEGMFTDCSLNPRFLHV